MLERNGVSCTTCSNAKELVNEMRRQDYDLLLSDIRMPETNGFEILALLRKSSIGNSHTIPIVAMTARGEGEKEAFIKGGFTDSIHKPFSMRTVGYGLFCGVTRCGRVTYTGFCHVHGRCA